ncbi:hypothetical protein [Oceanobacillus rekensis]|uniref:hypothetical protein n=1 Tax=Oceanobacillus rekensis TaxID=937927 RepID=UPI001121942B|nr:hypothetical protein [Oceanobacillus rekensis]
MRTVKVKLDYIKKIAGVYKKVKIIKVSNRFLKRSISITKNIFNLIKENTIPIVISLIVIGIFFFSFYIEIANDRADSFLDKGFWLDEILPNVIADSIGVVVSTFIIAGLFNYFQKKRELKMMYSVLGSKFENLIDLLGRNLLYLVKRDEKFITPRIKNEEIIILLKKLANNSGEHIDFGMFNKDFKIWDVTKSTSIIDGFYQEIPSIKEYEGKFYIFYNKILVLESKQKELRVVLEYLNFSENRGLYSSTLEELKSVECELKDKRSALIEHSRNDNNKEILNIKLRELLDGFTSFYQTKVNYFVKNNSDLLPMDIRMSLLKVKKYANDYSYAIREFDSPTLIRKYDKEEYRRVKRNDSIMALNKLSSELILLSRYFKSIK